MKIYLMQTMKQIRNRQIFKMTVMQISQHYQTRSGGCSQNMRPHHPSYTPAKKPANKQKSLSPLLRVRIPKRVSLLQFRKGCALHSRLFIDPTFYEVTESDDEKDVLEDPNILPGLALVQVNLRYL